MKVMIKYLYCLFFFRWKEVSELENDVARDMAWVDGANGLL